MPTLPNPLRIGRSSAAISPTAHYTGHVWVRNGLAPAGFATPEGRALHLACEPAMAASRLLGGPTIEDLLLARHRRIDELLRNAIRSGDVGVVLEIAAGLSPRGRRFSSEFGPDELVYVEADLPGMAARKRALLDRVGWGPGALRVIELDALADRPLPAIEPDRGLAIITEGLLNYFPREAVLGMWRRFGAALRDRPSGLYLSDLIVASDTPPVVSNLSEALLGAFVGGRVHRHFADGDAAAAALRSCGFAEVCLHRPRQRTGARLVRVVEAA